MSEKMLKFVSLDKEMPFKRGTNLRNANLSDADLDTTQLNGAIWNDKTIFPKGTFPT